MIIARQHMMVKPIEWMPTIFEAQSPSRRYKQMQLIYWMLLINQFDSPW